jgi:hypothetical protein
MGWHKSARAPTQVNVDDEHCSDQEGKHSQHTRHCLDRGVISRLRIASADQCRRYYEQDNRERGGKHRNGALHPRRKTVMVSGTTGPYIPGAPEQHKHQPVHGDDGEGMSERHCLIRTGR